MFPAPVSPLPPSFTYAEARVRKLMGDWAKLTAPGSPFLRGLSYAANSLRVATCLLAIALISSLLPLDTYTLPLMHVLIMLQIMAVVVHNVIGRWTQHKTAKRAYISLAIVSGYFAVAAITTAVVTHMLTLEPRMEVLMDVVRYQGWHLLLDVA